MKLKAWDNHEIEGELFINPEVDDTGVFYIHDKSMSGKRHYTLVRPTGLHDRHGDEVWDGDNVGTPDRKFVARVFQMDGGVDHGQWCCQHKDGDIQALYDAINGDGFEVIGHTFEEA